jgi:hypothetical protein
MKVFRSPEGIDWLVDVRLTGSSNALVTFRHPDGQTSRQDRYNWFISRGPEARSVTSRLSPDKVLQGLDDDELGRLYRRSMRVSRPDPLVPLGGSNGR